MSTRFSSSTFPFRRSWLCSSWRRGRLQANERSGLRIFLIGHVSDTEVISNFITSDVLYATLIHIVAWFSDSRNWISAVIKVLFLPRIRFLTWSWSGETSVEFVIRLWSRCTVKWCIQGHRTQEGHSLEQVSVSVGQPVCLTLLLKEYLIYIPSLFQTIPN